MPERVLNGTIAVLDFVVQRSLRQDGLYSMELAVVYNQVALICDPSDELRSSANRLAANAKNSANFRRFEYIQKSSGHLRVRAVVEG
jgi:hypothetical protein